MQAKHPLDYASPPVPPPEEFVNCYLDRSIFAALVFWPLGIVALIYSVRATMTKRHDPARARDYASRAAAWGMAALLVFVVALVALFVGSALFSEVNY